MHKSGDRHAFNPAQWFMEGYGSMWIQRLVLGLKPMKFQAEYNRFPSVLIEEIQEERLIPREEGSQLQLIHSQTEQTNLTPSQNMGRTETGNKFASYADEPGSRNNRELEEMNEEVGYSSLKKSKTGEGNRKVNVSEGERKVMLEKKTGFPSRGGGGWPLTAIRSP